MAIHAPGSLAIIKLSSSSSSPTPPSPPPSQGSLASWRAVQLQNDVGAGCEAILHHFIHLKKHFVFFLTFVPVPEVLSRARYHFLSSPPPGLNLIRCNFYHKRSSGVPRWLIVFVTYRVTTTSKWRLAGEETDHTIARSHSFHHGLGPERHRAITACKLVQDPQASTGSKGVVTALDECLEACGWPCINLALLSG